MNTGPSRKDEDCLYHYCYVAAFESIMRTGGADLPANHQCSNAIACGARTHEYTTGTVMYGEWQRPPQLVS